MRMKSWISDGPTMRSSGRLFLVCRLAADFVVGLRLREPLVQHAAVGAADQSSRRREASGLTHGVPRTPALRGQAVDERTEGEGRTPPVPKVHLKGIAAVRTLLAGECRIAQDPGRRQNVRPMPTLFRGETLRGCCF